MKLDIQDTQNDTPLAAKLLAWGEANGLKTRQQRADRLGVSIHTLQDWEQGCHSPRGFALAALLISLSEPPDRTASDLLEALEFYATGKQDDGALAKAVLAKAPGKETP